MADANSRDRGFGSGGWGVCPPIAWPPTTWPPAPHGEADNGFAACNVASFRPAVAAVLGHGVPAGAARLAQHRLSQPRQPTANQTIYF